MERFDRRTVLGLASTVGVGALAGCQALEDVASNDDGRRGTRPGDEAGGTTTTEGSAEGQGSGDGAGTSLYEEWLPAPEDGPYFAYAGDAQAVAAADLSAEATARIQNIFLPVSESVLTVPEVGEFANGTAGGVCTYEIGATTVRDRLVELASGYDVEPSTPPAGYEAFGIPTRTYWLSADHLLAADDEAFIDRMVATKTGGELPYSGALSDLDSRLPESPLFAASTESPSLFPDDAGIGYAWRFGTDAVTFAMVVEFEDQDAASRADVESATGEWPLGAYDVTQTRVDGQFAYFSGSIPKAEFDVLAREDPGTTVAPPEASFGITFDTGSDDEWDGDDAERITITHEGGDAIPLDEVVLVYANRPVAQLDRIASTPPGGDEWRAGGTWTLSNATAEPAFAIGKTLLVVWVGPDGDGTHVLARDNVTTR